MVVVESTSVLGDCIQLLSQRAERPPVNAMAVCGRVDIWSSLVDGAVYHKRSRVQQPALSTTNNLALLIHLDKVRPLDQGECDAKWIDPESVGLDGVTDGDVTRYTLVESVLSEDAEGCCQTSLKVLALFMLVGELRRACLH